MTSVGGYPRRGHAETSHHVGVRPYWEVARRGFRRYSTYRAATLAGLFTNCVFGFLRGYVLVALFRYHGHVGGYDESDTLTYTWLGQGAIMVVHLWSWTELAVRVRTGDIATDLSRPLDVQGYWLSQDLGRALYQLLTRGIVPFLVGAAWFSLRVPVHATTYAVFAISVVLGVVVSFAIRFLLNLTAFWLLDHRGVNTLASVATMFLSGFVVPIAFFPGWMATVLRLLPFAGIVQTPIDVFLEQRTGLAALGAIGLQVVWALVLLGAGRLVLAAATRKLVVQGG